MWDFSNASSKSQGLVSDVGSIFQQGEVRRLCRHSLIQGTWRFNLLKNVARYLYPNLRTNSSMDPKLAEETCLSWEFHFSTKLCWSPITLSAWCLASFAFFFFFPLKVIKGLFKLLPRKALWPSCFTWRVLILLGLSFPLFRHQWWSAQHHHYN